MSSSSLFFFLFLFLSNPFARSKRVRVTRLACDETQFPRLSKTCCFSARTALSAPQSSSSAAPSGPLLFIKFHSSLRGAPRAGNAPIQWTPWCSPSRVDSIAGRVVLMLFCSPLLLSQTHSQRRSTTSGTSEGPDCAPPYAPDEYKIPPVAHSQPPLALPS